MKLWKTPTIDPLDGFTPMAEDDWPVAVVDRWPAGRLRQSAMQAYDALARSGEIRPDGVHRYRSGVVVVMYRAKLPDAWIHDLLARAERALVSG